MAETITGTGIIIPDTKFPDTKAEDKFARSQSGLYIPNDPQSRAISESGIILNSVPSSLHIKNSNPDGFQLATDEELLNYGFKKPTEPKSRTSTEVVLALANPAKFLEREVKKSLGKIDEVTQQILTNFEGQNHPEADLVFWPEVMERQTETVKYFDKNSQQISEFHARMAGPLERIGLVISELSEENYFRKESEDLFLTPFSKLIQKYRVECGNLQKTPEMPDLTAKLIGLLDHFGDRTLSRIAIYGILEQITIPDSFRELILEKMDKFEDLDHPLSFELTLGLAQSNPESNWIKLQEKRRQELLARLDTSNQDLFDQYEELLGLSRGLVSSFDLANILSGKIGLEVESLFNKKGSSSLREPTKTEYEHSLYEKRLNGLDNAWAHHFDMISSGGRRANEITRTDNKLEFNSEYLQSLVHLYRWLGDYSQYIGSIHIHLDRSIHQHFPRLGHLFEQGRGAYDGVKRNNLGTWEVRNLNVPKAVNNLHPTRIADLIAMYISASSTDNEEGDFEEIQATPDKRYSLNQFIWGHIASYIQDPKGRLAALMALHDNSAFANANPLAFAISYKKESLATIGSSLMGRYTDEYQQAMVTILGALSGEDTIYYPDILMCGDSIERILDGKPGYLARMEPYESGVTEVTASIRISDTVLDQGREHIQINPRLPIIDRELFTRHQQIHLEEISREENNPPLRSYLTPEMHTRIIEDMSNRPLRDSIYSHIFDRITELHDFHHIFNNPLRPTVTPTRTPTPTEIPTFREIQTRSGFLAQFREYLRNRPQH